jgi:hypothetical protein
MMEHAVLDCSIIVSLTPVPPLVERLAIRLSPQAGKSLVIPVGEGYGRSQCGMFFKRRK